MNRYKICECGYVGEVWPSSGYPQQFYFYSISRDTHDEKLFDGVAGDIAEAVDSMHAHILFLTSPKDGNRDSAVSDDRKRVDQSPKHPRPASATVGVDFRDDMEPWIRLASAAA